MGINLEYARHIYIHRGAKYLLLHKVADLGCNVAFIKHMWALDLPPRYKSISKTCGTKTESMQLEDFCTQLQPEDPIILAVGQDYEDIDTWDHDIELIAEAGLSLRDVSDRISLYCDKRAKYDLIIAFPQRDENLKQIFELVNQYYSGRVKNFWKHVV